jgi:hypothetical protein
VPGENTALFEGLDRYCEIMTIPLPLKVGDEMIGYHPSFVDIEQNYHKTFLQDKLIKNGITLTSLLKR